MGVVIKYPIAVHVDNVGDIFLSDNTSGSQRRNNIDVRHCFIRDYVDDGTVKIQFFHSEENISDPFTNNLRNWLFEYFTSRYIHRE